MPFPCKAQHTTMYQHNIKIIMIRIILVGFLPCYNWLSCVLHCLGVATGWRWIKKTMVWACFSDWGWWCEMSSPVTPSIVMTPMNVMFVLLLLNTLLGRVVKGWMEQLSALLMCSKVMMRTVQCGSFITTIVVTHMQELSMIIIQCYNWSNISVIIIITLLMSPVINCL